MKAICRVAKIKGTGSITGKSEHNYRQGQVPNADPERQHLNHEYVNSYSRLGPAIESRLQDTGITKTRQDAVKGMEFVLTASPERFQRDENGQTIGDYRNSSWVKANLEFMKQQYGPNLVAFTLHQDEKTPHIHAVVVPITSDKRLCAKELFTPKTLRQLQTDYAEAMKPFGLERGVEGSRAKHTEMKHIYGLQQQERKAIEAELAPIQQPQPLLTIEQPSMLDLLSLDRWKQEQEARINAEYNQKLAEIRKAAEKAQNAAIANITAKEQEKVLQQRLETSERLKQANHDKAHQASEKFTKSSQLLEQVAVLLDEKRLNPQWIEQTAEMVRNRTLPKMEKDALEAIEGLSDIDQLVERLQKRGYEIEASEDGDLFIKDPKTEVRLDLLNHKVEGDALGSFIKESMEETLRQQQQAQPSKQNRGFGMGL